MATLLYATIAKDKENRDVMMDTNLPETHTPCSVIQSLVISY
jgi:hypothetical protein